MALLFHPPIFEYLLFILSFEVGSIGCDIIHQA